jgi:hypothetical protein
MWIYLPYDRGYGDVSTQDEKMDDGVSTYHEVNANKWGISKLMTHDNQHVQYDL